MVGREVVFRLEKKPRQPGEVVLVGGGCARRERRGLPALRGVSLQVRAGEIVGLAGVAGNGQSELAQVITGLRKCTAGRVLMQRRGVSQPAAPGTIIKRGVAHVPEDRTHVGTAPGLSLTDNLIMKNYRQPPHRPRLVARLRRRAAHQANQLKEHTTSSCPTSRRRRACCPAATCSG